MQLPHGGCNQAITLKTLLHSSRCRSSCSAAPDRREAGIAGTLFFVNFFVRNKPCHAPCIHHRRVATRKILGLAREPSFRRCASTLAADTLSYSRFDHQPCLDTDANSCKPTKGPFIIPVAPDRKSGIIAADTDPLMRRALSAPCNAHP